jgi:hypothetical protein
MSVASRSCGGSIVMFGIAAIGRVVVAAALINGLTRP